MKITEENKPKIFDITSNVRDKKTDAVKIAAKTADMFFNFEEEPNYRSCVLVFKNSDIKNTQICFTYNFVLSSFYYIPASFKLKDIKFDKGMYTFIDTEGKEKHATFKNLQKVMDNILFGRKKDMNQYIEDIFINCNKLSDTSDYPDKKLGLFTYVDDCYINQQTEHFAIFVYADSIEELKKLMPAIKKAMLVLEECDKKAKQIFIDKFEATKDDLQSIRLEIIYFYEDKHYELAYHVPDNKHYDYVYAKAIFNNKHEVTDANWGTI